MKYKITYGYTATGKPKIRRYETIEEAVAAASMIFALTGVAVGVETA